MAAQVLGSHALTLPHSYRETLSKVYHRPSQKNAVYVLAQDLFHFHQTNQISEELSKNVKSSKAAQIIWFRKLLESWKKSERIPQTAEEASQLIVKALEEHPREEIEELLSFYGLPKPSKSLPKGIKLELHTLPVDARAVADGDTVTVYVRALETQEISCVPNNVLKAYHQRQEARAQKKHAMAYDLHQQIIHSGYRVIRLQNEEVLASKYTIRLRGIDAPESKMPYGKEATEELIKIVQGKSLRVLIYEVDRYGRFVADIYCDSIFIQESLLRKGCAWYYYHYDKRLKLKNWEQEAREKQVGLWAASNPEEPWEWRKNQRNSNSAVLCRR